MKVEHPRCAGLDVHKKTVVACARIVQDDRVSQTTRTFKTTTAGLMELSAFLQTHQCTHVAMESTGVFWKPVWHVLEADFTLVLANAQFIKGMPGRKTDVGDAAWVAQLLAHGLIRASFVPPEPIQELRALTRQHKQLVREQTQHVQRIQKLLEDANLKLRCVLTDIVGVSGRAILDALVAGETDPLKLASLARRQVRATRAELAEALTGKVLPRHRILLKVHLQQVDALKLGQLTLEQELTQMLLPFRHQQELLITIPGVGPLVAQAIIAEIGVDMSRFPTVGHLISWAGLCPKNDESAGKKRSTRLRKGDPWLKTMLNQAAWAASRARGTYLQAQYQRLWRKRGQKKALMAVAASILTAAYHMLKNDVPYKELGADYFQRREPNKTLLRLVKQIERLGVEVRRDPQSSKNGIVIRQRQTAQEASPGMAE